MTPSPTPSVPTSLKIRTSPSEITYLTTNDGKFVVLEFVQDTPMVMQCDLNSGSMNPQPFEEVSELAESWGTYLPFDEVLTDGNYTIETSSQDYTLVINNYDGIFRITPIPSAY